MKRITTTKPQLQITLKSDADRESLIFGGKDRASVNTAAMGVVKFLYPQLLEGPCISHMTSDGGEQMEYPELDEWWSLCRVSIVAHSDPFVDHFRQEFGVFPHQGCLECCVRLALWQDY